MENTKHILRMFTALGISLIIILSYNSGVGPSIAQQQGGQNDTATQTQMQGQGNMSEFLKNSTSFGNATAELNVKHAPTFSTLTIQPWPMVEPSNEFNITGTLADKITLQPIPDSEVSFLYESVSEAIPLDSLETIDEQTTDTSGKFNATASAPDTQGIVSITAVYNGSGLYHSVASDPALVIVSNLTLPP